MAAATRLISADDHVQETPDLWTGRLSAERWGDRVPHVARQADGTERWVIDGRVRSDSRLAATGALCPVRFEEPQLWDEVPEASHSPVMRLEAMDRDSVETQVLYPSAAGISGEALGEIQDPELQAACVEAYNDWLLDVWAGASPRFVPQCLVPITSVAAAASEMERAVKRGHKGVVMTATPWLVNPDIPHLYDAAWDPFWASASDLGIPICWHSGGQPIGLMQTYEGFERPLARAFDSVRGPVSSCLIVGKFLFSGIGERFPDLKFVFGASGISWMSFELEVADHEWERICRKGPQPYEMDTPPTDIFRRQCFVTTSFDRAGLAARSFIGVQNIMWQSEFPMESSTWPNSAETVRKNFEGIPEEESARILFGNAASLYGIDGSSQATHPDGEAPRAQTQ